MKHLCTIRIHLKVCDPQIQCMIEQFLFSLSKWPLDPIFRHPYHMIGYIPHDIFQTFFQKIPLWLGSYPP